MNDKNIKDAFFGLTTMGEKGQAVVPAKVRKKMKLKKGEKFLVFSFDNDLLVFSKINGLEKLASDLSDKLKDINNIISKHNK